VLGEEEKGGKRENDRITRGQLRGSAPRLVIVSEFCNPAHLCASLGERGKGDHKKGKRRGGKKRGGGEGAGRASVAHNSGTLAGTATSSKGSDAGRLKWKEDREKKEEPLRGREGKRKGRERKRPQRPQAAINSALVPLLALSALQSGEEEEKT